MRNPDGFWGQARLAKLLTTFLGIALLAANVAPAQGSFANQTAEEIHVATTCIMPKALKRGYFPVQIEISNGRDSSVKLDLELGPLSSWDDQVNTVGTVKLAPGESKRLDWLAYAMPSARSFGNTRLSVSEGSSTLIWLQVHQIDSGSSSKGSAPLLASSFQPEKFAKGLNGISTPAGAIRSEGCLPTDLPSDWRAYSALNLVALDLSGKPPEAAQLEAILDWVSTGGLLILVGSHSQATQLLSGQDHLLADNALISETKGGKTSGRLVYRHQFGRIALHSDDTGPVSPEALLMESGWNYPVGFSALPTPPSGTLPTNFMNARLDIPGLGATPVASLIAVLLLFGILVGPVQFRRQKRKAASPFRFLIVTPLLGFGFSALILVFSLLRQGLDVKETSISVTWLDQRSHKATTLAKRVTFSGSVFRNSLHYSGRTLAAPSRPRSGGEKKTYSVNMDHGGTLEGHFLPVRVPTSQVVSTVANARGRIEFEKEGEDLYAVNGLDVQVITLTYRDASGAYFSLAQGHPLNPGSRAKVSPTDAIPNFSIPSLPGFIKPRATPQKEALPSVLAHFPAMLPTRSYKAHLAESPFLENGEVDRNVLGQSHVLIGSLPEETL